MTDVILLQVMKIEIFGERKNNKDTKNTKGNQLKRGPNKFEQISTNFYWVQNHVTHAKNVNHELQYRELKFAIKTILKHYVNKCNTCIIVTSLNYYFYC
jgi:hypothetical protein